MKQTTAHTDSGKFIGDTVYEFDGKQTHYHYELELCEPTAEDCSYWCARNGFTFGLKPITDNTCIASVEEVLKALPDTLSVYVIFQNKNHTQSAWHRWRLKWGKRTEALASFV